MASVNIEFSAFTDPRFKVLGKQLGVSHFDVIGRLAAVWMYCTEYQTHEVPALMVDVVAEQEGFAETLCLALLAERMDGGKIRVKGTKGRIEWLAKLRKNSKKGGEKTRAKWLAKKKPEGPVMAVQKEGPSTSTSSFTSASTSTLKTNTPLPPKGLQAIWNEHCGNLPKAETLNRQREGQAKARLAENSDPSYWVEIVLAISQNPFCRGENDRGWVATFDYLLRPGTHVQIAERRKASPLAARKADDEAYDREYAAAIAQAEADARAKGIL